MLLPQSSAFAALKNRLNSVSAIGYLHIPPRMCVCLLLPWILVAYLLYFLTSCSNVPSTPTASYDRPNRLKPRDDGSVRWVELLDRFKGIQDKAKRAKVPPHMQVEERASLLNSMLDPAKEKTLPDVPKVPSRPLSAEGIPLRPQATQHKSKSSLGNFSRLARGVGAQRNKK